MSDYLVYQETFTSRLGNETFCKGGISDKSLNPGLCRQCEGSLFMGVFAVGKFLVVICTAGIRSVVVFLGTKESLSNHSDRRLLGDDDRLQSCSDWTP